MPLEAGTKLGPYEVAAPIGAVDIYAVHIADDGESYYYTFQQAYSDLYLVDGIR